MARPIAAMRRNVVARWVGGAVAAAAVVLLAGGCLPSVTFRTGKPIGKDNLASLKPGATTKIELFERLGAPTAVVVRDEVTAIATPSTWAAPYLRGAAYRFDSGTFYELFPVARAVDDYLRIYYYQYVTSRKMNYFMILAVYESGTTKSDRLWVLVNEKTGVVEDYAYKKSGADVLFGIPRHAGRR